MTTLVVSDLHLGSQHGNDVLRRPEIRERLLSALEDADRLVLLGDTLELREQPLATVLETAYPFFEAVGEAMEGRAVAILAGNHDHQLASAMIEARRMRARRAPLALEETARPGGSGPLAAIARRMPRVEVTLAYPGLWLRPDLYATHGHYLDCHMRVPRAEVLGVAAIERLVGRLRDGDGTPDDYEAVIAPLYAFTYQLAHAHLPGHRAVGSDLSAQVWARLNRRPPSFRARLLGGVVIPAAVGVLNRAGLGPFTADLSGPSLRRAGLDAMGRVVERLGIEAEHVLFGHTHRPGPLPGDDGWAAPSGARLTNAGSWVYERGLLGPAAGDSPYWPGTCALVRDGGPPELCGLLGDLGHAELRPGAAPRAPVSSPA